MKEAEIRAQLEKILSSEGFVGAGRLGPFLRYLVEQTLAGEGQRLKESIVGLEVFQREAGYDPRIDPIVRVEARRLRGRLQEYYAGKGAGDSLLIDLPKGSYAPVFRPRGVEEPVQAAAPATPRRRYFWVGALALVLIPGIAAVLWLRSGRRPSRSDAAQSIAVLPFVNLSGDASNEYFSDGLTEELIDGLAKVEGLRVAARSSAFQFKGRQVDVREVGQKLAVTAVLEGSVRKSGDRIRVTAQLASAADGYHLWSQSYDRELKDVFAIQEEISRAIVNALRVQMRVERSRALARRYTDNIEAYNLYLKGRFQWNQYSDAGVKKAIEYFEQAIETDPGYAPAYAMLANTYGLIGYYRVLPPQEVWPKAKEAAQKAISIDGALAEAHAALGFVLGLHEWRWEESEREFRRALELNPGSADAHGAYAIACLLPRGRFAEANAEFQKALEADPLAVFANFGYAFSLVASGQLDRAVEQYRKTIELKSDHSDMWWDLGMAYAYKGNAKGAYDAFWKSNRLRGNPHWRPGPLELALMGEMRQAREATPRLERVAKEGHERAIHVARAYAAMRDKEAALRWLEEAFRVRDPELVWLKADPRFGNLRGDPQFEAMLKRVGL